ncbi:MAG: hypothetical protein R2695_21835 [Acidimicrobiales bacterium]
MAVRRATRFGTLFVSYLRFAHLTDGEVDQITEYCAVVAGHGALRDPEVPEPDAAPIEPIPATIIQPPAAAIGVAPRV